MKFSRSVGKLSKFRFVSTRMVVVKMKDGTHEKRMQTSTCDMGYNKSKVKGKSAKRAERAKRREDRVVGRARLVGIIPELGMGYDDETLQPGEFRLSCPHCAWKGEKNAASANECPDCGQHPLNHTKGDM